ncbi:MAG: hypothetical protein IT371_28080 [Deltaproteobacteria bacterium]|nr:hypothetical protein [Deltaproteobacteria bacterium]
MRSTPLPVAGMDVGDELLVMSVPRGDLQRGRRVARGSFGGLHGADLVTGDCTAEDGRPRRRGGGRAGPLTGVSDLATLLL